MKDDYTTNSHYLTYTFLFERLGEWKRLSEAPIYAFAALGINWSFNARLGHVHMEKAQYEYTTLILF